MLRVEYGVFMLQKYQKMIKHEGLILSVYFLKVNKYNLIQNMNYGYKTAFKLLILQ